MSGTDIAYGSRRDLGRKSVAEIVKELTGPVAPYPTVLCSRYAVSGTDAAYDPTLLCYARATRVRY
eukprot:2861602-Rhodomonas_salina.1